MNRRKIVSLLALCVMLLCLTGCGKDGKYDKAVASLNAGEYAKAIGQFEALQGYQDSNKYIMYAKCLQAGANGDYEAAINSLSSLGDFQETSLYVTYFSAKQCEAQEAFDEAETLYNTILLFKDATELKNTLPEKKYQAAEAHRLAGEHEAADRLFTSLGDYADSAAKKTQNAADYFFSVGSYADAWKKYNSLSEEYRTHAEDFAGLYAAAQALLDEGKLEDAQTAFRALGEYSDSAAKVEECGQAILARDYAVAKTLCENGQYEEARAAFGALGEYSDSAAKVEECAQAILAREYAAAKTLCENGQYEEARAAFGALGEYSDSQTQITECSYQEAASLYQEGKYREAYAIYTRIAEYQDVAKRLAEDKYLLTEAYRAQFEAGKTVTFGAYEQDNHEENGKEPIVWLVLESDGDTAVMISEDVLIYDYYFSDSAVAMGLMPYEESWAGSYARAFLNSDFLETAFSPEEQTRLVTTTVEAHKNPWFSSVDPGEDTQDRVWLLSTQEAMYYFETDESRRSSASETVKKQTALMNYSSWWLRTPASGESCPNSVFFEGDVSNCEGLNGWQYKDGYRPVIRIRIDAEKYAQ